MVSNEQFICWFVSKILAPRYRITIAFLFFNIHMGSRETMNPLQTETIQLLNHIDSSLLFLVDFFSSCFIFHFLWFVCCFSFCFSIFVCLLVFFTSYILHTYHTKAIANANTRNALGKKCRTYKNCSASRFFFSLISRCCKPKIVTKQPQNEKFVSLYFFSETKYVY